MNAPHNIDEILEYVFDVVIDIADTSEWSDSDVAIGLQRWIENQSDNQP